MTRNPNKKPPHPPRNLNPAFVAEKVKPRLTHAERNDRLIDACKKQIAWMISKTNDPALPRETTADEYIGMCMAMTRAQRGALAADPSAVVAFARAVRAAETGEVSE
ncbi:hypothetical protein [uncultured Thalassospira sp.]|uniref:hypothetical protein n=1 Tax=uncultured Thalassospira sp. TaxID=404382 RepID=UPI0030D72F00|tara:strand:+ start:9148 stop:9468 length:321 start_codon:yes stop_codon:yes gene_type:complete